MTVQDILYLWPLNPEYAVELVSNTKQTLLLLRNIYRPFLSAFLTQQLAVHKVRECYRPFAASQHTTT